MKDNFVVTENYLLVVDNSEIKEGDYFYRDSGVVSILTKELLEYYKSIKDNDTHTRYKIISHTPLNGAPYLNGVDRLPPNWRDNGEKHEYTEEDLIEILKLYSNHIQINFSPSATIQEPEEFIQSLQHPKYPIAFECEMFYRVKSGTIQEHKEGKVGYEYYERKTITNSDGRKEWVGKYIW
jgi:hypothetical protein